MRYRKERLLAQQLGRTQLEKARVMINHSQLDGKHTAAPRPEGTIPPSSSPAVRIAPDFGMTKSELERNMLEERRARSGSTEGKKVRGQHLTAKWFLRRLRLGD